MGRGEGQDDGQAALLNKDEAVASGDKAVARKKRRTTETSSQSAMKYFGSSRTIYLGGINPEISANDIFNHIRGGAVEALRFVTEKNCAFVDFVNEQAASSFYERLHFKRLNIKGTEVRVGWASPTPLAENVARAIQNGATRNVYIGGISLDEEDGKERWRETIRDAFSRFGMVDLIKLVPEKQCAFVHMTCIVDAMRAVNVLKGEDDGCWAELKLNFGSDRCADRRKKSDIKEEGQISEQNIATENVESSKEHPMRTVYLGGLSPDTTFTDLCNVIRGGLLEKVRITSEKRCAFVTFVEADAAEAFYNYCSTTGVIIRGGLRLRPGWGQPSAVPRAIKDALKQGATRNVYIGNINLSSLEEADLQKHFAQYGEIETITFMRRDREVAFVNFCMLLDAVKAVEGAKRDPLFKYCAISYGKDRCAQPLCVANTLPGTIFSHVSYSAQPSAYHSSGSTCHHSSQPQPFPQMISASNHHTAHYTDPSSFGPICSTFSPIQSPYQYQMQYQHSPRHPVLFSNPFPSYQQHQNSQYLSPFLPCAPDNKLPSLSYYYYSHGPYGS